MGREQQESSMRQSAARNGFSEIPQGDLQRLLSLRHHDPHSILGAHQTPRGIVVRSYRPGAEKVVLLVDDEKPRPMRARPEAGLFEVLIENRREVFRYRLEVHYPGDYQVT